MTAGFRPDCGALAEGVHRGRNVLIDQADAVAVGSASTGRRAERGQDAVPLAGGATGSARAASERRRAPRGRSAAGTSGMVITRANGAGDSLEEGSIRARRLTPAGPH